MRVSVAMLVAAAYTGLASACSQQPVGSNPSGNPITAPVLQVVEAGKPFAITWAPTTPGTVSIVLLRGPATNVIPIDCLGDNIPNTGTFSWTPATTLEADVTHYGLQIIVTGTGQFQYSTQFGISNSNPTVPKSSSAAAAAPPSATASVKPISQHTDGQPQVATSAVVLKPVTQIKDGQVQVPTSAVVSSPPPVITVTLKSNSTSSVPVSAYSTRASLKFTTRLNSTVVLPTKTLSLPVSLKTPPSGKAPSGVASGTGSGKVPQSPTTSSTLAISTGAAGRLFVQGGAVGLLGMLVAALL